jgi:hypothetical protein
MGVPKTRMLIGMWIVKATLRRFQVEMRILLGIRLQAIHVTFWHRICLHFVLDLRLSEAGFKSNGLINLVEEISRQHGIQAVT